MPPAEASQRHDRDTGESGSDLTAHRLVACSVGEQSSSALPTPLVPAALPGSTAVTPAGPATTGSAGPWGRRLAQGTLRGTPGCAGRECECPAWTHRQLGSARSGREETEQFVVKLGNTGPEAAGSWLSSCTSLSGVLPEPLVSKTAL